MFLTVHAVAGAAVGVLAGGPLVGFAASVLSHAILDIIPHGDEHLAPTCAGPACTHREEVRFLLRLAIVDGVVMLGVLAWMLTPWRALPIPAVAAGIVGGVLPDVIQGLGNIFTRSAFFTGFKRLHDWVHVDLFPYETPVVLGMLTQLAALTFCIGLYAAAA